MLKFKHRVTCLKLLYFFLAAGVISFFVTFLLSNRNFTVQGIKNKLYYLYWISEVNVDKEWLHQLTTRCEGNFVGYGNEFAVMKDVYFIPKEKITFQLHCQSDEVKYYSFRNTLSDKNHLNSWLQELHLISPSDGREVGEYQKKTILAVLRYEYANFYHQMTDFYNAFLVAKLLRINPDDLNVLLLDRSAPSILDKTWDVLFGDVTKVKGMNKPVVYKKLIWAVLGYNSPMNFHSLDSLPYTEEFSHFFRTRYGAGSKTLDCNGISILFIWRRDYVAHPGNPSGSISRKIKNEKELVDGVQKVFPGHNVAGIQLDQHEMTDQVRWVSQTDILVGMHGAGMSHIMELPKHAGVLELYPTYWPKTNRHFRAMARWKGLFYRSWQNTNPTNELENKFTRIPPSVVVHNLKSIYRDMCGVA